VSPLPGRIHIATAGQPLESDAIQMKLESEGIESFTEGEMTIAVDPLLSNAIGGIRILVAEEDEEQARDVVERYRQEERESLELRAKTCPECGGQNGQPIRRPLWVGFLIVLTLGIAALLYPWPKYSCPDCGHKWR